MYTKRGYSLLELLVAVAIIGILAALVLSGVQVAREASRRLACQNNLKQIGLAIANYESAHGCYPFGVGGAGPARWLTRWSAHSQLLPFLEQSALFHGINFSFAPWGHDDQYSPPNLTALRTKVAGFLCPSDTDSITELYGLAHNNYRASAGTQMWNLTAHSPNSTGRNDGAYWYQSRTAPRDIHDGLAATAAFSERCLGDSGNPHLRRDYYYWDDPSAAVCSRSDPNTTPRYAFGEIEWSGQRWADGNMLYTRYQHTLTPNRPSCNFGDDDWTGLVVVTATSMHNGGVNTLSCDGSVRFIQDSINEAVWRGMATLAGGEVIPVEGGK
jgi:prepilin-type N-terminal cleavage/methylation domain-containing protein/prepilin-type processing-associated H-X9-DG protein